MMRDTLRRLEKELHLSLKMTEILKEAIAATREAMDASSELDDNIPQEPEEIETPSKKGKTTKKNEFALHILIIKILQKHRGGLKLPEICEEVIAAGYKTKSKDLTNNLYVTLSKLQKEGKIKKMEDKKFKVS